MVEIVLSTFLGSCAAFSVTCLFVPFKKYFMRFVPILDIFFAAFAVFGIIAVYFFIPRLIVPRRILFSMKIIITLFYEVWENTYCEGCGDTRVHT